MKLNKQVKKVFCILVEGLRYKLHIETHCAAFYSCWTYVIKLCGKVDRPQLSAKHHRDRLFEGKNSTCISAHTDRFENFHHTRHTH